ncbi:TPA: hypothetical protein ACH3X3_001158 [Trebouxia sp. C0006]
MSLHVESIEEGLRSLVPREDLAVKVEPPQIPHTASQDAIRKQACNNTMGSQICSTKAIVLSDTTPDISQPMAIDQSSHFKQMPINVLTQACLQHAYNHIDAQEIASFQALKKRPLDGKHPEYAKKAFAGRVPYLDEFRAGLKNSWYNDSSQVQEAVMRVEECARDTGLAEDEKRICFEAHL